MHTLLGITISGLLVLAGQLPTKTTHQRLVLHFDVNKTIIATDIVQGKALAQTINGILAEFTLFAWDGSVTESYYAYVTRQIARNHPNLSRASEAFKHERSRLLREFPAYLEHHHPDLYKTYVTEAAHMVQLLEAESPTIFPSFFKLIAWLNESDYRDRYVIHLRTFGQDLPEIVPVLEKRAQLAFSAFGIFREHKLHVGTDTDKAIYNSAQELYDILTSSGKNYAIQDDYQYWKISNFQARGGKPFPIDLHDASVVALFFDDNANDLDKPIVCPITPQGSLESTERLIDLGTIVVVNPKEAILNEDYFIEKVKATLAF